MITHNWQLLPSIGNGGAEVQKNRVRNVYDECLQDPNLKSTRLRIVRPCPWRRPVVPYVELAKLVVVYVAFAMDMSPLQ
jgi:hypothetical protein